MIASPFGAGSPDAKWRPDLVDWHPINEHVEAELVRLEGKNSPTSERSVCSNSCDNIHSGTIQDQGYPCLMLAK